MKDALPPHDLAAEQAVIGSILYEPANALDRCAEILEAGGREFYDLRHRTIYAAAMSLHAERVPATTLAVFSHLKNNSPKDLDQIGGMAYLMGFEAVACPASMVDYFLTSIRDRYMSRRIIEVCADAAAQAMDAGNHAGNLLDEVERDILTIRAGRSVSGAVPLKELIPLAITDLETDHHREGKPSGIPTGLMDLDKATRGLQDAEMIVIAARPSVGKTALAMNIAEYVACDLALPVGVFSLEMSGKSLARRLLTSRARVNNRDMQDGKFINSDFPKVTHAGAKLSKSPMWIDDGSAQSINQIRAKARRLHQQHGIRLFILDYLQLATSVGSHRKYESRQNEITEISAGLKAIAKELNVPFVVLSQLNRDIDKDKNRRPRLSDLRESGAIEQDADVIAFLYRAPMKDGDEDLPTQQVKLLIAKQRNGPADVLLDLIFLKSCTRFECAARVQTETKPERRYHDH